MPTTYNRESVLLRNLLQGAWDDVSGDFVNDVLDAVSGLDIAKLQSLLDEVQSLGPNFRKAISKPVDTIVNTIALKANSYWESQLKNPSSIPNSYQNTIRQLTANQIKLFAEKSPERFIHPEIVRQIQYLKESDLTRSFDVTSIAERLKRVASQEKYFENLSDVQVARQWHATSVFLGRENKVLKGMISGPTDPPICLVCMHMVGTSIDLKKTADRLEKALDYKTVDEYKEAFPFPRLADVDNISRDDLAAKGFIVPFHGNCRHSLVYLI
jgi:hypothetical protein